MKKFIFGSLLVSIILFLSGCTSNEDLPTKEKTIVPAFNKKDPYSRVTINLKKKGFGTIRSKSFTKDGGNGEANLPSGVEDQVHFIEVVNNSGGIINVVVTLFEHGDYNDAGRRNGRTHILRYNRIQSTANEISILSDKANSFKSSFGRRKYWSSLVSGYTITIETVSDEYP